MGDKFEYCLVKGFSTVENGRPSLMIQSSQENMFFIFGGIEGRKNPYELVKWEIQFDSQVNHKPSIFASLDNFISAS